MIGENLGLGLALLGGIFSFLSPCILPLIPVYLANLAGVTPEELRLTRGVQGAVFKNALGFVVGFSVAFILMGAAASSIGFLLLQYQDLISQIGGIIVIIFGLQLSGIINLSFLLKSVGTRYQFGTAGLLKSLLIGFVFAMAWTPCIGPVLGSILILAGAAGSVGWGVALLSAYSLGLAVPFLLVALFAAFLLEKIRLINRYLPLINKIAGATLIVMGLLLVTNTFIRLNAILL